MQITIKPQDRTPSEKLELDLHPSLILRLREYAKSLKDSDVSYVVSQILEQILPGEKTSKKSKGSALGKQKQEHFKEAAKKVA